MPNLFFLQKHHSKPHRAFVQRFTPFAKSLITLPSSPLPSHFLPSVPGFTWLIIHPDKEKWAKKHHPATTLRGKVKRNEKNLIKIVII
ncbi:MAG: hypothetical protein IJL48_01335 [Bacteroidales bacterium]|nr:hypothetical protein [Bacteroidales bacterium]